MVGAAVVEGAERGHIFAFARTPGAVARALASAAEPF